MTKCTMAREFLSPDLNLLIFVGIHGDVHERGGDRDTVRGARD